MRRRELLQINGPDDEIGLQRLHVLSGIDYADMGEVRATYRAWPGPFFWMPYLLIWVLVVVVFLTAPDRDEAVFRAALLGGLALLGGTVCLLAYGLERHRVCDHGLVLGFRRRSTYVVPWETLDPGRVRISRRMGLLGRRPELPQTSPRYRVGLFSLDGLVVNGLDTAITSSWNQLDPRRVFSPFAWWLLATRRADDLVSQIEAAMVADGYPAEGLAARARTQAFTVPWSPSETSPVPPRSGTDPTIGVDGPLMQP